MADLLLVRIECQALGSCNSRCELSNVRPRTEAIGDHGTVTLHRLGHDLDSWLFASKLAKRFGRLQHPALSPVPRMVDAENAR